METKNITNENDSDNLFEKLKQIGQSEESIDSKLEKLSKLTNGYDELKSGTSFEVQANAIELLGGSYKRHDDQILLLKHKLKKQVNEIQNVKDYIEKKNHENYMAIAITTHLDTSRNNHRMILYYSKNENQFKVYHSYRNDNGTINIKCCIKKLTNITEWIMCLEKLINSKEWNKETINRYWELCFGSHIDSTLKLLNMKLNQPLSTSLIATEYTLEKAK